MSSSTTRTDALRTRLDSAGSAISPEEGRSLLDEIDQLHLEAAQLRRDIVQEQQEKALLESQLRQARKMEALGRLTAGVAHDLNNLLTLVSMNAGSVLGSLQPSDPHFELVEEIQQAVARGSALTRQLLAFSRSKPPKPARVDLAELVQGMVRMLDRLLGEDIRIVVQPSGQNWTVWADPAHLEQCLLNLALNARDAMNGRGVLAIDLAEVQLRPEQCAVRAGLQPGVHVRLTVADTGCGMSQEVAAKVFEPFFTTKEAGAGTGLGLAVVHDAVRQAGGHVAVESEPGRGTSFVLHFPQAAAITQVSSGPARSSREGVCTATVLVVEDEPGVLKAMARHLQRAGFRVLHAGSADEAIVIGEQYEGAIELLMTDVIMPGVNGVELVRRWTARWPSTPVLYVSGYLDDVLQRAGLPSAEQRLLRKPFTPAGLMDAVRQAILPGNE